MVEILGNGINVEAIVGSIGSTISNYANNVVSTLINAVRQIGNYLYAGLLMFVDWLKKVVIILWEFFKKQFSAYMSLLYSDPLKFSLATVNLMLILRRFISPPPIYYNAPVVERKEATFEGVYE